VFSQVLKKITWQGTNLYNCKLIALNMPTVYFAIDIDVVSVGDSRPAAISDNALGNGRR